VCGLKNEYGLHTSFYELDGDKLVAVFTPRREHQGYPDRLHGGIAASVLDETIGRAIRLRYGDEMWGVTIQLMTRFRCPIPLGEPLRVVAHMTRETRRHFEGDGSLLLADGTLAAEGHGRYLKMPVERITDFDFEEQEWRVIESPDDPLEFNVKAVKPAPSKTHER
jgi:acyl-coenzyme A thioesterase PaaI-like protein